MSHISSGDELLVLRLDCARRSELSWNEEGGRVHDIQTGMAREPENHDMSSACSRDTVTKTYCAVHPSADALASYPHICRSYGGGTNEYELISNDDNEAFRKCGAFLLKRSIKPSRSFQKIILTHFSPLKSSTFLTGFTSPNNSPLRLPATLSRTSSFIPHGNIRMQAYHLDSFCRLFFPPPRSEPRL